MNSEHNEEEPMEFIEAPLANPPLNLPDYEEREHMSRAEAVRILMQLQKAEARAGHPNINAALEMGIAYIIKRHRDNCRYKAKRRAAAMAAAAKEGK